MWRILTLVLCCLMFCGCDKKDSPPIDASETSSHMFSEELSQQIKDSLDFVALVRVHSTSEGNYSIDVYPDDSDITFMGNHILNSMKVCKELVEKLDSVCVNLVVEDSGMFFTSGDDCYGVILDDMSGEPRVRRIESEEDICRIFPASAEYINKQNLTPEDVEIYKEVMDILEREYEAPEEELYARLAPQYSMTPEELEKFMQSMLDAMC